MSTNTLPGPWSYSSLKKFRTCAKQFYEIKVARNFKEPDFTEATMYGKTYHEAAEFYVRDSTPLPAAFEFTRKHLDMLRGIPGVKLCEHKMALTKELAPCDFDSQHAWCRGVADLLIVDEANGLARVIDYKTGSSKYADPKQLELMALMVFKHFPTIRKVKGGLLFVVHNDFKSAAYEVDRESEYWRGWLDDVTRLEGCYNTGVWNPTRSGLCRKHCPVTSCSHNGNH